MAGARELTWQRGASPPPLLAELRGLRGEHVERPGWIWVSSDIVKGGRERWMPVTAELAEVVEEIRANVAVDEYVLPAQRFRDPRADADEHVLARARGYRDYRGLRRETDA
jgi:integrase